MNDEGKYVLVQEDVLPDVFKKVLTAKALLLRDEARSLTQACKLVDISRSAFYKYKDSIHYYEDDQKKQIVTIYLKLCDEPGVLSSVLSTLYEYKTNILTVNQNIPAETIAVVTITVRMDTCSAAIEDVLENLHAVSGVIAARKI